MPATTAPNTKAIGNQIVAFLSALTYPNTSLVYNSGQLEMINDVVSRVSDGGAVFEVYGHTDSSDRRGFGGRIWDPQSWLIVSLCSLETPALAAQIYDVRDALVQPFQVHATLGTAVFNLFHAELKANSGMFGRATRNGQVLRAHTIELTTKQEWTVPTPPGIIS